MLDDVLALAAICYIWWSVIALEQKRIADVSALFLSSFAFSCFVVVKDI
jgi:hypothetical protein